MRNRDEGNPLASSLTMAAACSQSLSLSTIVARAILAKATCKLQLVDSRDPYDRVSTATTATFDWDDSHE